MSIYEYINFSNHKDVMQKKIFPQCICSNKEDQTKVLSHREDGNTVSLICSNLIQPLEAYCQDNVFCARSVASKFRTEIRLPLGRSFPLFILLFFCAHFSERLQSQDFLQSAYDFRGQTGPLVKLISITSRNYRQNKKQH